MSCPMFFILVVSMCLCYCIRVRVRASYVAMHGKQGWKLQTELDTLVAKVFKARYFRFCIDLMMRQKLYSICWNTVQRCNPN